MGGASGHMNHLHSDLDLTFAKLKKILSLASAGKISVSEKVDGANINLSYRNGQATYARNKGDLLALGKNINDLINRNFKGGDKVKNAYVNAFKSYESAIQKLPKDIIEKLFQNGTIFYNAEIMGPQFTNLINYDKNIITIHPSGTKKVNLTTKEIIPYDDEENNKLLDKIIDNQEEKNTGQSFQLQKTAFLKLKGLSDKEDLNIAKARINKIIKKVGLSDGNTIEDYLKNHLSSFISSRLPEISEEIQNLIIDNILGKAKIAGKLPKGTSKETRSRILQVKKDSQNVIKKAIYPIEDAIHDFSVELLKGVQSLYILDNKNELKRQRKELARAIKIIQSSNNEDAIKLLNQQLSKIKNSEGINTPIEGVVFQYGDKIYKFTGNFAPMNQIMGLFKYGRGKIPKFDELDEEQEIENDSIGKVIAAIPGAYKPPHNGHYEMAKYIANNPKVDVVYILISPKPRAANNAEKRISINKNMSLKLWQLYTKNDKKIKPIVSGTSSPVKAVFDFMEKLNPGDTYVLAQGEKEEQNKHSRFAKIQDYADKNNLGINTKIVNVPPMAGGISGTETRNLIVNDEKDKFISILPKHLSPKEKELAWIIVNEQQDNIFEMVIKNAVYETIRKNGNEYCVYSKKGRNLGCSDSKRGAEKRLGQVEFFKHQNESEEVKEDFQQDVKKGHEKKKKELIDNGEQDTGFPYKEKAQTKRNKSAPPGFAGGLGENEELNEISVMSTGCVQGNLNKSKKNKINGLIREKEEEQMINRDEFIQEMILREKIREVIKFVHSKRLQEKQQLKLEENIIRKHVRAILKESEVDADTPHHSTSINILEDLLKSILPKIENDYKSLTTDVEQRKSFRSHIINAINSTISPDMSRDIADEENSEKYIPITEEEGDSIDVKIGEEPDEDKFVDIDKPSGQSKEDEEEEKINDFSIEGEDETGRNMAMKTFDSIENQILDSFNILENENDQDIFRDYLSINLKLYMDRWEKELQPNLEEPDSAEYEKAKDELENKESEGGSLDLEPAEEEI